MKRQEFCHACPINLLCTDNIDSIEISYCPVCKRYGADVKSRWRTYTVKTTLGLQRARSTEINFTKLDIYLSDEVVNSCPRVSFSLTIKEKTAAYTDYVANAIKQHGSFGSHFTSESHDENSRRQLTRRRLSSYVCAGCLVQESDKLYEKILDYALTRNRLHKVLKGDA